MKLPSVSFEFKSDNESVPPLSVVLLDGGRFDWHEKEQDLERGVLTVHRLSPVECVLRGPLSIHSGNFAKILRGGRFSVSIEVTRQDLVVERRVFASCYPSSLCRKYPIEFRFWSEG